MAQLPSGRGIAPLCCIGCKTGQRRSGVPRSLRRRNASSPSVSGPAASVPASASMSAILARSSNPPSGHESRQARRSAGLFGDGAVHKRHHRHLGWRIRPPFCCFAGSPFTTAGPVRAVHRDFRHEKHRTSAGARAGCVTRKRRERALWPLAACVLAVRYRLFGRQRGHRIHPGGAARRNNPRDQSCTNTKHHGRCRKPGRDVHGEPE